MQPTQRLDQIGSLIYGGQWAAGMARDLGVAERTVDRWRGDKAPVPAGVWRDLERIARALADAVPDTATARIADLMDAADLAAS